MAKLQPRGRRKKSTDKAVKDTKSKILLFLCSNKEFVISTTIRNGVNMRNTYQAPILSEFLWSRFGLHFQMANHYIKNDFIDFIDEGHSPRTHTIKRDIYTFRKVFNYLEDIRYKLVLIRTPYFEDCFASHYNQIINKNLSEKTEELRKAIIQILYLSPTALKIFLDNTSKKRFETTLPQSLTEIAVPTKQELKRNLKKYLGIDISMNGLNKFQYNLIWFLYYCVIIDYMSDRAAQLIIDDYRKKTERLKAYPKDELQLLEHIKKVNSTINFRPDGLPVDIPKDANGKTWKTVKGGGTRNEYDTVELQ
jgi:hypothetical protein